MFHMGSGWEWGGSMGLGWIFMLLFWGLVIWGFVVLVRSVRPSTGHGVADKALSILMERYAKGELEQKEFQRLRKDLQ